MDKLSLYCLYTVTKYAVASIFWCLLKSANKVKKDSCSAKIAKVTIPMRCLILQLFDGPLGVVELREDQQKPDTEDTNDIPNLYIRNTKVSYGGIMVLTLLIVSFGILTLSSAIEDNARVQ